MSVHDVQVRTLDGQPTSLSEFEGQTKLIVNVASFCGLTPHYTGMQALQERYGDQGFTVLAFPCNQFGSQEPGTTDEIKTFCETNYGVTFPLFEKIEVNGPDRHPLYDELTRVADESGHTGDIRWNFEKFVVSPDGKQITRFNPTVTPDDPKLVATIEANLAAVTQVSEVPASE